MKFTPFWLLIAGTVSIAAFTNSISAVWAKGDNKLSIYLVYLIILSPMVFISFGLVTEKVGLVVSSGVIDSLLTISSILVGLIVFREWSQLTFWQYLGMILAVIGIVLMVFFGSKPDSTDSVRTGLEVRDKK